MAQDQLRGALDSIRVRLQTELESQIAALEEQQTKAVAEAVRVAGEDADRKWTARLKGIESEWAARLQSELAAAAGEAERRTIAECARVRAEVEGVADQSVAKARAETETERQRRAQLEKKARQWEKGVEAEQQRREAAERALKEHREAAEKDDRLRREAAEKEERARREAAEEEERRRREAAKEEERLRREASEKERLRVEAVEKERTQREELEKAERARREAAEREERQRVHAEFEAQLAAAEQALTAERARAAALDIERTTIAEESRAHEQEIAASLEQERLRGRELAGELEAARHSLAAAVASEHKLHSELESQRERIRELDEGLKQAQVSLTGEKERIAAEREAVAARAAAIASERDAVAAQAAAIASERTAVAAQAAAIVSELAALEAEREASAHVPAPSDRERFVRGVTEARASERQSQLAVIERLLIATRAISGAGSLSDTLTTLVTTAATAAPRVAAFIVNGRMLQGWKAAGFSDTSKIVPSSLPLDDGSPLAAAVEARQPVPVTAEAAPPFAALESERAGVAIPIIVGGRTVALLYADDGGLPESQAPSSWPEEVQILGQHASVCLAHLTAVRTAQAVRMEGPSQPASAPDPVPIEPATDEDNGARRYARLLVSEIKLYNESAVRIGREKRDLMNRLRPEIDRARRLYEERVSPAIGARGWYFQQELVQTLADGDPALLGSPAASRQ